MDEVFKRIQQGGLKVSVWKEVSTLSCSHNWERKSEPDPEKVKAVRDYPVPTTTKGIPAFLGLIG